MTIRLNNKTAVVTGAANGIGKQIARTLAMHGAKVWAWDIQDKGLEEVNSSDSPHHISTRTVDVTDATQIENTIEEIGDVDIFVHSAGGVCGQIGKPVSEVTHKEFEQLFKVNVDGVFLITRAILPAMKRNKWGRIITISSGAGLGVSLTGIQAYASAKAAQIGLVRQLGHELGEFGVTVNSVAPGFIRSNPSTEKQWHAMGEKKQLQLLNAHSIKRAGQPEDIANAVLFFASDLASWITGQTLSVNGGR
jgi:3-oxoacyl-[acyl-carrier protein] reductase